MALELPVLEFIKQRLNEADLTLEVRRGTAYYDMFVKPQQLMLQPLLTAMETSLTAQSVRRIQLTDSPDTFDEDLVDDLTSNLYVPRFAGAFASTTVRVFYAAPVAKQFPAFTAEFLTADGFSYFNSQDVSISQAEMVLNTDGDLYYVDIPARAQNEGDDYNVAVGDIVAFVNDVEAISVTNLTAAENGLPRETNTELLSRVQQSIGVRDFETGKGINAIINQTFPGIFKQITAIGFGDQEMMRDIVYNAHVGGNTDVYLKTPALTVKTKDVVGLVFDGTRELGKTTYKQLTNTTFADPAADLKTPFIVVGSMTVKSDTIETATSFVTAHVPAVTGIDLSGAEFIKLKVDAGGTYKNIKVSGSNPAQTQKFEIINSINAAVGMTIAKAVGVDQISITSPTVGTGSELSFATPDSPRTDATPTLLPNLLLAPYSYISGVSGVGPNPAVTVVGDVATEYIETVDYEVDYPNGKIRKLPGSAILSGDTVVGPFSDGIISTSSDIFSSPTAGIFSLVSPGDTINITASPNVTLGTYVVKERVDSQTLRIQGMVPTGNDSNVTYNIVSNQVVVLKYKYNPLSVDIGNQVLLPDGRTRGIRPGRDEFTITELPYIDIVSIEEIDSDTLEGLGEFLTPNGGYGYGGYGKGPYGIDQSGDYTVIINSPPERFSMFEDALIVFDPTLLGKSYRITYYSAPEVGQVHDVSRSDLERVTGASVLPKNYVPGFVDIDIKIVRDSTNVSTPTNSALADMVKELIEAVPAGAGSALQASEIVRLLEDEGVDYVQVPFDMRLNIVNTDGSRTTRTSQNLLQLEDIVLPKFTNNYVTNRIMHLYARNVTVTEVSA